MNTIYLKEFIKTGRFGTISIGSTKAEVVTALGNKFDFADCGESQIINIGCLEWCMRRESDFVFVLKTALLQEECK